MTVAVVIDFSAHAQDEPNSAAATQILPHLSLQNVRNTKIGTLSKLSRSVGIEVSELIDYFRQLAEKAPEKDALPSPGWVKKISEEKEITIREILFFPLIEAEYFKRAGHADCHETAIGSWQEIQKFSAEREELYLEREKLGGLMCGSSGIALMNELIKQGEISCSKNRTKKERQAAEKEEERPIKIFYAEKARGDRISEVRQKLDCNIEKIVLAQNAGAVSQVTIRSAVKRIWESVKK
ncbi:MAG: hypothetical protein ACKVJU_02900 [Verrucomicrobiales bacterium]